jgi:hypothetical protein
MKSSVKMVMDADQCLLIFAEFESVESAFAGFPVGRDIRYLGSDYAYTIIV